MATHSDLVHTLSLLLACRRNGFFCLPLRTGQEWRCGDVCYAVPLLNYRVVVIWIRFSLLLLEIEVRTGVHMDVLGSAVRNNLRLRQDGI